MFTMFNRRSGSSNERYTSEEQVEVAVERQDQQQPQQDESLTATELHADVAGNDGSRIDRGDGTSSHEDEEAEYEDEDEDDDDHTVILSPDEEEIPPPFPSDLVIHHHPFRLGRMANDRRTTHRILLTQRNTGNNEDDEDDDPLRHVLDEATDQDFSTEQNSKMKPTKIAGGLLFNAKYDAYNALTLFTLPFCV